MKKILVAGGVIALVWYFWNRAQAQQGSSVSTAQAPLTNATPKTIRLGDINLDGPATSNKTPTVASVS